MTRIGEGSASTTAAALGVLAVGILALGCAGTAPAPGGPAEARPPEPEPADLPEPERAVVRGGALPPIPLRRGPLALGVQYPPAGARIAVRDSNFLFGTVGTGEARLEVDGRAVPVAPNGAFLAWLPVPPAGSGDTATYVLVARRTAPAADEAGGAPRTEAPRGADTLRRADTLRHMIRLPALPYRGPPGAVWVDTSFLRAPVERWALPDEPLAFRVRASPDARVWISAGGRSFPLRPAERAEDAAVHEGRVAAGRLRAAACGASAGRPGAAEGSAAPPGSPGRCAAGGLDTLTLRVVAARGRDTARLVRDYPLRVLDPEALPTVRLEEAPDPVHGRSGVVVGRPRPYGPYRWRFPPGTTGTVDGRVADRLRLRLTPELAAWVLEEDAVLLPGPGPVEAYVGDLRVEPRRDRLVLRAGTGAAVPVAVDAPDPRTLVVTLYGALGETNRVAYGADDPLLEGVRWEQLPGRRYRATLRLRAPVWGWDVAYERGRADVYEGPRSPAQGEGPDAVLRVDVRRPPAVDPQEPLRGRRIAVDPGHPGGGAHGPTGLYEGDANLAVAQRLAGLLEEAGAEPVLIRRDTAAVGLYERTARARAVEAELFVSIHNNALPDGQRPFGREGTSTYYYHPHSEPLARAVQAGMVGWMGLRDLGVKWGDLAVARLSWMPSVLAEGAFMMFPRHEAALRTPSFQERYARGVLEGLRSFLGERRSSGGSGGVSGERGSGEG